MFHVWEPGLREIDWNSLLGRSIDSITNIFGNQPYNPWGGYGGSGLPPGTQPTAAQQQLALACAQSGGQYNYTFDKCLPRSPQNADFAFTGSIWFWVALAVLIVALTKKGR